MIGQAKPVVRETGKVLWRKHKSNSVPVILTALALNMLKHTEVRIFTVTRQPIPVGQCQSSERERWI
jgi:hypothetical protein